MKNLLIVVLLVGAACSSYGNTGDSARFYFSKAKQLQEARRWNEAEIQYLKAIGFEPDNLELQQFLGSYYMQLSRYAEARQVLEKIHRLKPADTLALRQLALLSFNLKKYEDAIRYYQELDVKVPSEATDLQLGMAYRETEDFGQSIAWFSKAIQKNPRNSLATYELGRAYVESDDYKRAIPLYQQAIAMDSSRYMWPYELGLLYFGENNFYAAIDWFQRAAAFGMPKDLTWLENLGNAQLGTKEYKNGITTLEAVLLRKPNNPTILYTIAQSFYQHQEYKEAVTYWEKVLMVDSTNYRAMYMEGMAYQKLGKTAKGRELCDKAIYFDPQLIRLRTEKFNF